MWPNDASNRPGNDGLLVRDRRFQLRVAAAGVELASKNFILDLAPDEDRRPIYIAVNDSLVAIPTMLLIVGGAVIDYAGFTPVFIAVGARSAGAAVLATTLPSHATRPEQLRRG